MQNHDSNMRAPARTENSSIDWPQLHQNAVQIIALLAFAATAIKTGFWYQLTGLSALLLNGNLLLMSGFFCLFALTYASTHPGRATMAAAGGVLIAVLM